MDSRMMLLLLLLAVWLIRVSAAWDQRDKSKRRLVIFEECLTSVRGAIWQKESRNSYLIFRSVCLVPQWWDYCTRFLIFYLKNIFFKIHIGSCSISKRMPTTYSSGPGFYTRIFFRSMTR
jgi:hypothetical protein